MLRDIEQLESKLKRVNRWAENDGPVYIQTDNPDDVNWQFYWFKDQLSDFKESIRRKILSFGHQILEKGPSNGLRVVRAGTSSIVVKNQASGSKPHQNVMKDKLFQQEGLMEIRDMYRYGQAEFDKIQSEYLTDIMDFRFIQLFSKGFIRGVSDGIEIQFESCIANAGETQIKFLIGVYAHLLESLEVQYKEFPKQKRVVAEGHSLFEFFKGEIGIHLFHLPHQNPLPIRVKVFHGKDRVQDQPNANEVIRVYDGDSTVTDVRTGFTNAKNISANELKLFIFGAISAN